MAQEPTREPLVEPVDADGSGAATRRTVIKAGAAALALGGSGLGVALVRAQEATPGTSTPAGGTATECVLTPELTEGPLLPRRRADSGRHHRGQAGRAPGAPHRRPGHDRLRSAGQRRGRDLAL